MIFDAEERRTLTAEAMRHPLPGDHFHEMFAFHVFVVARQGDDLVYMTGSPPVTFPDTAKLETATVEKFRERFAYGSIPGYWVDLAERGHEVDGWLARWALTNTSPIRENETDDAG